MAVPKLKAKTELAVADPLRAGRDALSRGEWEEARALFEAALERGESAEAIEALGMAAWWLDDANVTIDSRERAYRLYREQGDVAAAARMAIWLAWDSLVPRRAGRRERLAASGSSVPRAVSSAWRDSSCSSARSSHSLSASGHGRR